MNFAAQARTKVKATHPEATVHERRANGIIHRLADLDGKRRFAGDYFIGPIHYGGPDWQEIDTAFIPSTAPWDHEMTKADFHVHALSRLDAGQVVEYRDGDEYVRFQPMALQYSNDLDQIQPIAMPGNVEAEVDDDTLTWADGYGPGRSLSWQAQTARLAKVLTISDLPPAEQFILDGGNPCLELNLIFAYSSGVTPYINGEPWNRKQVDTQGLVEFRDDTGNVLWWFNLPRSWDSDRNEQLGTFRFKRVGNALYVSHRVPLSFVQAATYPLMVDVDVDDQVDAGTDDGFEMESSGDMYIAADTVYVFANPAEASRRWGGVRFHSPTDGFPPNGATIDVAYIEIYCYVTASDDANFDFHAEDAAGPPTFTTDNSDISDRTRTAASEPWVEDSLGIGWSQSPSIVSVIQELVTDYTVTSIVLVLKPKTDEAKSLCFWTFDDHSAEAAKLHIEYTAGGVTTRRYGLTVLGVG